MGNFFVGLYHFFSRNKLAFWLVLFLIIGLSVFCVTKVKMDEQITQKTGKQSNIARIQEVAGNIRLTDNLIIRIYPSDTTVPADISAMTSFAAELSDSLLANFDSTFIGSISPDPADTGFQYLAGLIGRDLPVFLDEEDYHTLDSLTTPASIHRIMENNYRLLTTPAGMVMRDRILSDPLGITSLAMNKLKSLQVGDEYTVIDGYVFTRDGNNLLLFLTSANPAGETARNGMLLAGIDQQINHLKKTYPGIEATYWGGVAMAVGNATQVKKDIMLTLSLAIFLIFLLLAWYFRSFRIPLLGFLPAIFGGVTALAILYLFKGTISAIALGIGTVLLGLIVDYALYIINRYRRSGSVETVLREMSQTIIVCALTSIGAFLCLVFLDSGVLLDLGLFAALSLAGAAIFALVFLPHMLGTKIAQMKETQKPNIVDKLCHIRFERKLWLIFLLLVGAVASFFFMGKVQFEKDMNSMNFVTPELKAAGDQLERISEVSLKTMYVVTEGKTLDEALASAALIQQPVSGLATRGIIRNFSGVQQMLLPEEIQRQRMERWVHFWTPERRAVVQQEITGIARSQGLKAGIFDNFFRMTEEPGNGLSETEKRALSNGFFSNWVSIHDHSVYVSTILKVPESNRERVYHSLGNSPDVTVFDKLQLTQVFVDTVRSDFDRLITLTMVFVTLLLIFSFGRIETGLIASIPMFFSWALTLGFMGITGIRFNIFNIIISSFVFGLGVDYSILMMRGLLHRYKYGEDVLDTYKVSIFLSSATTIIGVGVLFFARHPALHSIALVSVFGVFMVVMATWTLEPLPVRWFLFNRKEKGCSPVFGRAFLHAIFIAWVPISTIALILITYATLISPILPLKRAKKQQLFRRLFSTLSRWYIATNFPKNHKVENEGGEDFSRPSIIIVNHQSLIETPAMLRLHPNILILTNEWVFHHWMFGPVARIAGFIPITTGIDESLERIRKQTSEGYSILIFPEGSRSKDGHIQRFHRGAFYLSEKLNIDIVPVMMFGSGDFLKKSDFWGKPNRLFMKIMPRIHPDDTRFGTTYQERTRNIRHYYIEEYRKYKLEHGTPDYYRRVVIHNYLFKGPILEWYVRVKMMLGDNFRQFHEHLPLKGKILDLGCGYGYIDYMLAYTSSEREITAVDHDAEKISVAQHCFGKSKMTEFICADITEFSFGPQDGIVLGDVLHYLNANQQESLLHRCMENLNPGGVLLIREGVRDESGKHRVTRLTEFYSTRMGFNKTPDPGKHLQFLSADTIRDLAMKHDMTVTILSEKKTTSNKLFKITSASTD